MSYTVLAVVSIALASPTCLFKLTTNAGIALQLCIWYVLAFAPTKRLFTTAVEAALFEDLKYMR